MTTIWLDRNADELAILKANLDLFDIENHGANHIAAIVGAGGEYDQKAADEICRMGYKIAGFSVNADAGATLSRAAVRDRLRHVKGRGLVFV